MSRVPLEILTGPSIVQYGPISTLSSICALFPMTAVGCITVLLLIHFQHGHDPGLRGDIVVNKSFPVKHPYFSSVPDNFHNQFQLITGNYRSSEACLVYTGEKNRTFHAGE